MKQNKKLRRGEELETGVPWFWLPLSLIQRGKVLNEQTLFAIYHLRVSCNPPGRAGSGVGKTYELLKCGQQTDYLYEHLVCQQRSITRRRKL